MKKSLLMVAGVAALSFASQGAFATCADIAAAMAGKDISTTVGAVGNEGYGLPMWISFVDETGKVCSVNHSKSTGLSTANNSWLGSRDISVQKANTANAFSLDGFSISTTNLYGVTLPGGHLWGLQHSNPINGNIAYTGLPSDYGKGINDPLVGKRLGGVNVFGGGLALYKAGKVKVGAVGVSGDTSCTDHAVAWRVRKLLGLDDVPAGFFSGYTLLPGTKGSVVKGDEMVIKLSGNADNLADTNKQPPCANHQVKNPSAGPARGVILEP